MGTMTTFWKNLGNGTPSATTKDQTASWAIAHWKHHGKCLWIKGYSSDDADNPGETSQNMIFPADCIKEFKTILKQWEAANK